MDSGEIIWLTNSEFKLLYVLAENAREVVPRTKIMYRLYGNNITVIDRAIDAHINRLRRKIDMGSSKNLSSVPFTAEAMFWHWKPK